MKWILSPTFWLHLELLKQLETLISWKPDNWRLALSFVIEENILKRFIFFSAPMIWRCRFYRTWSCSALGRSLPSSFRDLPSTNPERISTVVLAKMTWYDLINYKFSDFLIFKESGGDSRVKVAWIKNVRSEKFPNNLLFLYD